MSYQPDSSRPYDQGSSTAEADRKPSGYPPSPESPISTLLHWLIANTLGFAIATALLSVMRESAVAIFVGRGGIEALFASGFVVGAIVGPWQAHILKGKVPHFRSWRWILVSILGSYLGVLLGGLVLWGFGKVIVDFRVGISMEIIQFAAPAIFGAMVGGCVGLGQVLVLTQPIWGLRHWWMANVIGRSLGWLSVVYLLFLLPEAVLDNSATFPNPPVAMLCGAVGGLIYGGITAITLPKLTSR
ncbi:hypothetical protein [Vacuolonema iberomarrocanum]|uniref:hypothetical protein n=1 Tax=Vacuolonema iberomarrocanum TaxID=3454632 RepID=UPI001A03307D|nr:hypothetical protein [filamentous cyanobacterium LEGE 07170]